MAFFHLFDRRRIVRRRTCFPIYKHAHGLRTIPILAAARVPLSPARGFCYAPRP